MRKFSLNLVLATAVLCLSSSLADPAWSQSRLQDRDGRQTVAPSQMEQQPMLSEELAQPSKTKAGARLETAPSSDLPGLPDISPNARITTQSEREGSEGSKHTNASPGGIVYPSGIPSEIRIGPQEPTPPWQRTFLAGLLVFQLIVCVVWAITFKMAYGSNRTASEVDHESGKLVTGPGPRFR